MTEALWMPFAVAGISILLVLAINLILFNNFRRRHKKRIDSLEEDCKIAVEKAVNTGLEEYKKVLEAEWSAQVSLLKQEIRERAEFEFGLLKTKIGNIQPSYPKKLEAQQKLAVLVNTIGMAVSTGKQDFIQWKTDIQQYLLQYAGFINDKTEAHLTLAIEACLGSSVSETSLQLAEAKQQTKEMATVR